VQHSSHINNARSLQKIVFQQPQREITNFYRVCKRNLISGIVCVKRINHNFRNLSYLLKECKTSLSENERQHIIIDSQCYLFYPEWHVGFTTVFDGLPYSYEPIGVFEEVSLAIVVTWTLLAQIMFWQMPCPGSGELNLWTQIRHCHLSGSYLQC